MKLAVCCAAVLAVTFAARPSLAQMPIHVARSVTRFDVRPDGTYDSRSEIEFKVETDAAARSIAQLPLPYSPSLETFEIVRAETRKPDGRILPVTPDQIQERLAPAAAGAVDFDDRKIKVVVFPEAAGGDILAVTQLRHTTRALFSGKVSFNTVFAGLPWDFVETTISVPTGMALQTDVRGMTLQSGVEAGRTVYRFTGRQINVTGQAHAVAPMDYAPMFIASNFRDWAEVANSFGRLNLPKAAVTPKIQALADQITTGVSDRRIQARLLYDWVSTHVRYVNVILGIGGFEGHPAESVADHGYGDCKDHTILLAALLAARGISSEMALINLGNIYSLPTPANLSVFNHVISYLPEFDLYLDTTAGAAPFGVLPFSEHGKSVLHVASAGRVERSVQLVFEPDNTSFLSTTAQLRPDGVITGETTTTATGPFGLDLRLASRGFQTQTNAANGVLTRNGTPGTGRFNKLGTESLTAAMTVSGSFTLDARKETLDGDSFALPTGLRVMARPGDFLLGQLTQRPMPAQESVPCWSGRQTESLSLKLPPGRKPERLPKPISIESNGIAYHTQWALEGDTVSVQRSFSAHVDSALCGPVLRAQLASALDQIRADLNRKISLAEP